MNEKISQHHLDRIAFVYIRQSTQTQVEHNTESKRRQYALAQRATEFGWKNVEIVDEDLGRSGSGTVERKGFERLVAAVGMGKAGAVFSLEASRLARNNRDWHQLIDICAIVNTLIIDQDGVYDAGILNDRLLLGLKGTMSEFELSLFRQRSHEALLQKASRGELYFTVPIGYIVSKDDRCEQDPDERVRAGVHLVFDKFAEMRSARQVMLWFRHEGIMLPSVKYGAQGREVVWKLPVYNTIGLFLTNPIYAGAYAFGRTTTETYFENGRARKKGGKRLEQVRWHTLIKDHHQGYISWSTYERNRSQLNENANMKGLMTVRGAPREGRSLLAGLLRCGRCGRKIHVAYGGKKGMVIRYFCRGIDGHARERCTAFGGLRVDAAVEDMILKVIQPASIEAAIRAAERTNSVGEEKRESFELALRQAEYEAQRAHRQYDAVDPENRLVAGELERRWNDTIAKVNECKSALDDLSSLSESKKEHLSFEDLSHLAEDLPLIWRSELSDMRTKKMIVRTLIKEMIADTDKNPGMIQLTIHWHGGDHTVVGVRRSKSGEHRYTTDVETVEIVRSLSRVMRDSAIASTLNRLGRMTSRGNTWTESRVAALRFNSEIPGYDKSRNSEVITMDEAAKLLGISPMSVHRLIEQGIIAAVQHVPYAPQIIMKETLNSLQVQKAVDRIKSKTRVPLPADPNQQMLNFA